MSCAPASCIWRASKFAPILCTVLVPATLSYAIMAGGEFDLPVDTPSGRIDTLGVTSPFNFVGALELTLGASVYKGSAVAFGGGWAWIAGVTGLPLIPEPGGLVFLGIGLLVRMRRQTDNER